MAFSDKLDEQIKAAMKQGEDVRLSVYRLLKSAVKYHQVDKKLQEVTDTDFLAVVQKQIKQRQDSVEAYKQGGRDELVSKEQEEIAILREFLPAALSEAELDALVRETIRQVGATSRKEMGQVMKALAGKTAGRADGKTVSQLVQKHLGG